MCGVGQNNANHLFNAHYDFPAVSLYSDNNSKKKPFLSQLDRKE